MFLFIALATVLSAVAQVPQPAISLTIKADPETVKAGSPVRIDITITNVSKQTIRVDRETIEAMGESTHQFDVRDSSGNPVPETRYYRQFKGDPLTWHNFRRSALAPGATTKDEATLTKLFDLSIPGEYTVQARRYDEFSSRTWVKSNTIKITVQ